jgi:hypothetical protein
VLHIWAKEEILLPIPYSRDVLREIVAVFISEILVNVSVLIFKIILLYFSIVN